MNDGFLLIVSCSVFMVDFHPLMMGQGLGNPTSSCVHADHLEKITLSVIVAFFLVVGTFFKPFIINSVDLGKW